MRKIAYVIGRFSPAHKGHILFMLWLLSRFDEIIIGIGSCYEVGINRHPLLAVFREKIILWSLLDAGIDPARVSFVHLQDFPNNWAGWWKHIMSAPGVERVTHFVTGNKEQILDEIEKRNMKLAFKLINPEKDLPKKFFFPYHSTDLRNAIFQNDYKLFWEMASSGLIALKGNIGGAVGIRDALADNGTRFIPGRQAVDLIITCRSESGNGRMVLTGYRKEEKENFGGWLAVPGGEIKTYESPMNATTREGEEESGLDIKIVARHLEPTDVLVNGIMAEMRFVKLYSTNDSALGGNQGGSSQLSHIDLDVTPKRLNGMLKSESDLERVAFRSEEYVLRKGLAFQQTDMLKTVLGRK